MIATEAEARDFVAARCDSEGMRKLDQLAAMLAEENDHQNLVSRSSLSQLWLRHFADSAQLLDHVSRETADWIDLGTGAGFPGLVIACMRPGFSVTMVESRSKRIAWLDRAFAALGLANARVAGSPVQAVPSFPAEVISARAFAPMDRLLNLSARFSTSDTLWVLPKGRSAAQEWQSLPEPVRRMFHVKQSQTDENSGILVGYGKAEIRS